MHRRAVRRLARRVRPRDAGRDAARRDLDDLRDGRPRWTGLARSDRGRYPLRPPPARRPVRERVDEHERPDLGSRPASFTAGPAATTRGERSPTTEGERAPSSGRSPRPRGGPPSRGDASSATGEGGAVVRGRAKPRKNRRVRGRDASAQPPRWRSPRHELDPDPPSRAGSALRRTLRSPRFARHSGAPRSPGPPPARGA